MKATTISLMLNTEMLIPNGHLVCHSCDNPNCVNPSHLWVGTNYDNTIDSIKKGRKFIPENIYKNATHCKRGHEFDSYNTRYTKRKNNKISRSCIDCANTKFSKPKQKELL